MARFARLPDDDRLAEPPIEDELVRVYPVRTNLSRFLLHDPTADCFVELRQSIDGRFTEFSPLLRQALARTTSKLGLPQKRKLQLKCVVTTAGQNRRGAVFSHRAGISLHGEISSSRNSAFNRVAIP